MIRAWRHAAACRTPGAPTAWMRAIARREALRIVAAQDRNAHGDQAESAIDAQPSSDLRIDVNRALYAHLTEGERLLLAYRYWLDYSDSQIAAELEIPLGTAKVRLHRARRKLEAALDHTGP